MEYFDDNDVKKSAAILKTYCKVHTHCSKDCIFYGQEYIKYANSEKKIYCKLHTQVPCHWALEEDKNE